MASCSPRGPWEHRPPRWSVSWVPAPALDVSIISVLLPDPDTPHTPTSTPSGNATGSPFRLARAPRMVIHPVGAERDSSFACRASSVPDDRLGLGDCSGVPCAGDLAAPQLAGPRPAVNQVVGGAHHQRVVFDHDGEQFALDRSALTYSMPAPPAQTVSAPMERIHLHRMQPPRRLVEQQR